MIVIGNYDFRPSGTVAKSIEIACALHAAGLPVELWSMRKDGPLLSRVPDGLTVRQIGPGGPLAGRVAGLVVNLPSYIRAIRTYTPAVLLSGGNHFHRISRMALELSGKRSQVRFGARASNSSQRAGRSLSEANHRIRRKFQGVDFVAAVSQELADELRGASLDADIYSIPNGVDLSRIARLSNQPFRHRFFEEAGGPVMVTMGRLEHQKGFDVVIRALARTPADLGARLIVIGTGPARQRAALQWLARREGVADRVDFVGYHDNPFAILARADLFVSGSRWEGASNTLIEALACGLPLVATDCPTGNREVLMRGPYGTLAPVDAPDALARAIGRELALRRDRVTQAAGAQHWSLDTCLTQWTHLLGDELAARSTTSPPFHLRPFFASS